MEEVDNIRQELQEEKINIAFIEVMLDKIEEKNDNRQA